VAVCRNIDFIITGAGGSATWHPNLSSKVWIYSLTKALSFFPLLSFLFSFSFAFLLLPLICPS
jgi:hypothetical protein